ncbi:hypothetical protein [Deinococcus maricopensis]|uniref:Uncharacterized protein n=1 Tax=Deinococcus maricopensis (strain DSM 21211 / LMG 22137 / NRRL B-23946 / LB-34) TaxID=709986 RepID=E8UAL2_DEIML|nr:hypothetical protein [Deinococcus maricopensis]ADV68101.1 hypothetical protein Deima_2466 [Deinococcus maricopensis DSM 21211]
MKDHSERDLLRELFPDTAREEYGDGPTERTTLGLYPVPDGRLALVQGDQLAELEPLERAGKAAFMCDLCQVTRSRDEVNVYRVGVAARRYLYLTLCTNTPACQQRAGAARLSALADRVFPIEHA